MPKSLPNARQNEQPMSAYEWMRWQETSQAATMEPELGLAADCFDWSPIPVFLRGLNGAVAHHEARLIAPSFGDLGGLHVRGKPKHVI